MKRLSIRAWISIITFVMIGVVLYFSRHELYHAWQLFGQINIWTLLLIVPIILVGYGATGEMVFSYLRQKGFAREVGSLTQMRISMELNFVNHILPSGGVSGLSYMNWRLKKLGVTAGRATMAQVVRYFMAFASLATLLVIAVVLVTIDGTVNRWIILMSGSLVVLMTAATLSAIYLLKSAVRIERLSYWLRRVGNRLIRRVTFGRVKTAIKVEPILEFLNDMHDDYKALVRDKRVLLQPFLWGLLFTATEVAVFWIVFWALGSPVNPAPILIAYGLASLTAFAVVTPGGAGAYEAVMVLVLAIAGLGNSQAIAGVVLTRAIALLVTIAVGYIFYQQALIKYGKRATE